RRRLSSHKGNFGHILVVAGSARFSGAAVFAASAALRSGAGLVTLGIPRSLVQAIIKIKPKEIMLLPLPETKDKAISVAAVKEIQKSSFDILAIGPGMGQDKSTQALVRKIVRGIKKPMVIDADALNALVGHLGLLLSTIDYRLSTILTPHPGEMARLLGTTVDKVQVKRKGIVRKFAKDYRVTAVLKGHNTIVADYKGNLYINKTGNPGMATAGAGDVLTGTIAAFLGQGLDAFSAAKYAVYLHGLAGDLAAREKTQISLIASDILAKIPEAVQYSS
ncbi:MAG: NAD(P)H-hydrate dehydratase, partial [Candidatus Omnitrophota bacterium]